MKTPDQDGFPNYNFWEDLKRLGKTAIQFVSITPFDARGYRSDHVRVETEVRPDQLFVGETIDQFSWRTSGEPTQELDINEINAELWGNTYTHPFDHNPDQDIR